MKSEWHTQGNIINWEQINGKNCHITLTQRPPYCDRGNYLATLFVNDDAHPIKLFIDVADGWPRYYMNKERAKLEVEDWLKKRKEWVD